MINCKKKLSLAQIKLLWEVTPLDPNRPAHRHVYVDKFMPIYEIEIQTAKALAKRDLIELKERTTPIFQNPYYVVRLKLPTPEYVLQQLYEFDVFQKLRQ